jgi:hypothetical protein
MLRRCLSIAVLVLLCVAAAWTVITSPRPDPMTQAVALMRADLAQARQRWTAAPVAHYRLEMAVIRSGPTGSASCTYTVEVQMEQIVQIDANTCSPTAPKSISAMFDDIQFSIDSYAGKECGPNGCVCDGPEGVGAQYDTQFGYPRQVTFGPARQYAYLFHTSKDTFCSIVGYGYTCWGLVQLTTLP